MKKFLFILAALSLALGACEAKKAEDTKKTEEKAEGEGEKAEGEGAEGEAAEGEAAEGEAAEGEAADETAEGEAAEGDATAAVEGEAAEGDAAPAAEGENAHIASIQKFYAQTNAKTFPMELFAETLEAEIEFSVLNPGKVDLATLKTSLEMGWGMSSDLQTKAQRIIDLGTGTYLVDAYEYGTFDGAIMGLQPTNEKMGYGSLQTFTFDEAGKISKLTMRQNELALLTQMKLMPPVMGNPPAIREMPAGDTIIVKVDETPNAELIKVVEAMYATEDVRPFDVAAHRANFADNLVVGLPPYSDRNLDTMMKEAEIFAGGLSDASTVDPTYWTAGNLIVASATGRATHTGKLGPFEATDKQFDNPFVVFYTVEDGKVAAINGYANPLYAMAQLGLLPPEMMGGAEAKADAPKAEKAEEEAPAAE